MPFGSTLLLLESMELCHGFVELGHSSKEKQNWKEQLLDSQQAKECQERGEHAQKGTHLRQWHLLAPACVLIAGDCMYARA